MTWVPVDKSGLAGSLEKFEAKESRTTRGVRDFVGVPIDGFIPFPLPPQHPVRASLLDSVQSELLEATERLGELNGLGLAIPNPSLLLYPLLLREAQLSSRIENTIATAEEVVLAEAGSIPDGTDAAEVRNYIMAVEAGRRSKLPISKRLILLMHKELMKGVRGDSQQPGEFRSTHVGIGKEDGILSTARFIPPPPQRVVELLNELEAFVHGTEHGYPYLVQVAMTHYQFETIHPFRDGNGRMGRALVAMAMCRDTDPRGPLDKPLLYMSDYLEANRQEYYDRLLAVSIRSDWEGWLRFFLKGIGEQAIATIACVRAILDLRDRWRGMVTRAKASALVPSLVDALFEHPFVTASSVAKRFTIKPQAAQRHINRLVEDGILFEATGRDYARVWVARPLLELVEGPRRGSS